MSFLTPLFLLGGLAVSLPILFHLIRRTPQGKKVFSSVMFLSPSPPRMSKRSRIEDWLLLLLRGLAVCLLALAFARPFWRAQASVPAASDNRQRVVLLVDTSASMRRDGFAQQVQQAVDEVLAGLNPLDDVALLRFDATPETVVGFAEWSALPVNNRLSTLRSRLSQLTPGWFDSQLGDGLIAAAEELDVDSAESSRRKSIIVISDFQAGSRWEALNGYSWPEKISVQLKRIRNPQQPTNAALQIVQDEQHSDGPVRVRVMNSADAQRESFTLRWEGDTQQQSESMPVAVPPGESRVIRAPPVPEGAEYTRLVLSGDDVDFDNPCFVSQRPAPEMTVVFLGAEKQQSGPQDLRFFLEPMFPSNTTRKVNIVGWQPNAETPPVAGEKIDLLIVGGELSAPQIDWLLPWLEAGGELLFVGRDPDQMAAASALLGGETLPVTEGNRTGYRMVGRVDFSHSIFRPFDDPRFSDFTKVRFWQHRVIDLTAVPNVRTLLALDDGVPLLAEIPRGKGRLFLLTSGWNRDDSDLAVWSKFVPIMNGLLDYARGEQTVGRQLLVGNELPLNSLGLEAETVFVGVRESVSSHPQNSVFRFTAPGIYRFASRADELATDRAIKIAVNLPPAESRTEPLPVEVLEGAGLTLTQNPFAPSPELTETQQRQLMNVELESKQQLWRWLLVAALLALLLESFLASRRARQRAVLPSAG